MRSGPQGSHDDRRCVHNFATICGGSPGKEGRLDHDAKDVPYSNPLPLSLQSASSPLPNQSKQDRSPPQLSPYARRLRLLHLVRDLVQHAGNATRFASATAVDQRLLAAVALELLAQLVPLAHHGGDAGQVRVVAALLRDGLGVEDAGVDHLADAVMDLALDGDVARGAEVGRQPARHPAALFELEAREEREDL